jgi:hypothetical protein
VQKFRGTARQTKIIFEVTLRDGNVALRSRSHEHPCRSLERSYERTTARRRFRDAEFDFRSSMLV